MMDGHDRFYFITFVANAVGKNLRYDQFQLFHILLARIASTASSVKCGLLLQMAGVVTCWP